ncbi:MAG TPA: DUF2924 domain-containing protein [Stellaceae bacterium]|nr:DUF2924 domain-containing protein [Stellaceae bacterium]
MRFVGILIVLARYQSQAAVMPKEQKTGANLVRHWRGHTHAVLVGEDGFEYEGQRYPSLTVIAERITGAHWSGPRFFGLTKRARASSPAGAGQ